MPQGSHGPTMACKTHYGIPHSWCLENWFSTLSGKPPLSQMVLYRGNSDLALLGREWLKTLHYHEWRKASGRCSAGFLRIHHPGQLSTLRGWVACTKKVKGGFQVLIDPLCLAVGLRVATQGQTDLSPKEQRSVSLPRI